MHATRWGRPAWLAALLLLLTAAPSREQAPDAVEVKVVKYDGLGKTIRQLKGKVVVVDFWGIT